MKIKAISLLLILGAVTALGACQQPTGGDTGTQSNPTTRNDGNNNKTRPDASKNDREDNDNKSDSTKQNDDNDRDNDNDNAKKAPAKSQ